MKKFLWLFILIATTSKAQLSDEAYISVLTCGPYQEELYSAFGHSAFRIFDPVKGIDVACNYGMFDFSQPNFYLNFALGNNLYMLGIEDYQRFESRYIRENRFIHEQILNLTNDQKQKLFAYLQRNALPENASYYYDYFYNNCSTKIRDVLREALGDDVKFDESYITTDMTIRELTDLYIKKQQPWGDLGIDICLGLPMDKKAAPLEYMFLPDYVESGFDRASVSQNGSIVPLVKEKRMNYEERELDPEKGLPHPLYLTGIIALLALALTVRDFRKQKLSNGFDIALFTTTGLLGILLALLWFVTNHQAAAKNFNLLWAFPLHFVAAIAMIKSRRWLKNYFLFTTILTVITLLSWPFLPQQLHYALIPFVAAIGIRAFAQYYFRKEPAGTPETTSNS
jgi:hypothetical protein